ncbi:MULTISPECIES: hypothetical protein [Methylibium]|nr:MULTISPECIES: hypothetical protein [Methylibium]
MAAIIVARGPARRAKRAPASNFHDEKWLCCNAKSYDAAVPQIFSWRKN